MTQQAHPESLRQSLFNLGEYGVLLRLEAPPEIIEGGLRGFLAWEPAALSTRTTIAVVCGLDLTEVRSWLRDCAEWMAGLFPVDTTKDANQVARSGCSPREFAVWTTRGLVLNRPVLPSWALPDLAGLVESVVQRFPREGMRDALNRMGARFPHSADQLADAYVASDWYQQRWRSQARPLSRVVIRRSRYPIESSLSVEEGAVILTFSTWVVVEYEALLWIYDQEEFSVIEE
ncbi:MAG: hypothetical protein H6724_15610 [Sandaracinus sp.]|nr:hypothetical protein [Sandaracinus sp.]